MAKKKTKLQPESTASESTEPKLETASESENPKTQIEDPIGDVTGGEAKTAIEAEPEPEGGGGFNPRKKPADSAWALALEEHSPSISENIPSVSAVSEAEIAKEEQLDTEASESEPKPRPPAKLERLQKILAAAGIASRRRAEELIEQGRVQLNGKVVTVLGTKADAGRDHIRVDGKLLQGPERLRYFVLNKPRGFVTTVKDPEGRPTVMQFFEKMKERLYPVGRLDYMSEGLLVVTNDGDLANRLTKAASGVEKTYLVKVAGQPTEAELEILRGGVAIERGAPGSAKVHTSPARIRQVRQGDNPWYEVVLIEGRNRELRKMFEEIGHFVEKIRRTGYGPLVLDLEPGNLRELEPRELELLRQAAEGKLRTPKSKEIRRRNLADAGLLPTVLPKPSGRPRSTKPIENVRSEEGSPAASRPSDLRPKKFGADRPSRPARPYIKNAAPKPFRPDRARPARPAAEGFRPAAGRTSAPNPVRSFSHTEDETPRRGAMGGQASFGSARPAGRSFDRPVYDRPGAGPARTGSAGTGRTNTGRPFTGKPKFDKPAWKKPERPQKTDRPAKPAFQRPAPPRRETPAREARVRDEDSGPVRPPNLRIEEIKSDSQSPARSYKPRPFQASNFEPRSGAPRSSSSRPTSSRPYADRPNRPSRPTSERPTSSARTGSARTGPAKPFRGEGGLARPFTTSSGRPRPGGARPSSKHGWKPKPSFGGPAKPASGSRSKPKPGAPTDRSSSVGWKPGGFSKSGYKGKPAGKRSGGKKRS